MLRIDLRSLNESDFEKLCEDRCPESSTLDFKRQLPGNSDKDKHELLKDICAFANTDGGDLVFGIDDTDGNAKTVKPISQETPDTVKCRILQVVDAGLEPRIQGIILHHVAVKDGYVLIIRVPASFDGPHCIRIDNKRRFVMRNGVSTSDLTYAQLRAAFDRSATLAQRGRDFIEERTRLMRAENTAGSPGMRPISSVHIVPIAGLAGRSTIDIRAIYDGDYSMFYNREWGCSMSRTLNLDGLVVHPAGDRNKWAGYVHIFRTGAIEAASVAGGYNPNSQNNEIWSESLTAFYRRNVKIIIEAMTKWGISGPAIFGVSLLGVSDCALPNGIFSYTQNSVTDRPNLILQPQWIDDLISVDVDRLIQPVMDTLWQAFNIERCPYFDVATGEYRSAR